MQTTAIVFDLDGTLVDTAPDLIRAANDVLAAEGFARVASDILKPSISFGGKRILETGLRVHGVTETAERLEELFESFLVSYTANIAAESRPFPGVLDTLDRLAEAGAVLAVCTNKREDLSRLLLDQLDMLRRFAFLAGRDTFAVCKPHPEHLLRTIDAAGGRGRRAVMVGDSATDVNTARAAAVPVIGVTFGYTDVPMAELAPDALIDDYAGFPAALDKVLTGTA